MLNGSAGVDPGRAASGSGSAPAPVAKPIRVTLVGAQADSKVVVRNGSGEVVWAGRIVLGEKRVVKATPPVTVKARNAGALEAQVNGKDKGPLGGSASRGSGPSTGRPRTERRGRRPRTALGDVGQTRAEQMELRHAVRA